MAAEDDSPASGTGIGGVEVVGASLGLGYTTVSGVEVVGASLWLGCATIDGVEVVGPSLRLRYATALDAAALFELGSDSEVIRFFSWGPYVSVSESAAYIDGLAGERERGERLDFLIVGSDDQAIGVTGLSEFSRRDRRAVVGTWLGRSYWGTGANRSAKALIAWLAFAVLGLERLGASTDVENPRSQSALADWASCPRGRCVAGTATASRCTTCCCTRG
jgi:ribosomal-protein-alanine N-acetyltransferase